MDAVAELLTVIKEYGSFAACLYVALELRYIRRDLQLHVEHFHKTEAIHG